MTNLKAMDAIISAMAGVGCFILWLSLVGPAMQMLAFFAGLGIAIGVALAVWQWLGRRSVRR